MEIKMGECRMEGCYEIAEVLLSEERLDQLMDSSHEYPHTINRNFADLYLYHPRPAAEDVVTADVSRKGGWFCVTLKIRRGKEMLAEFFNMHKVVHPISDENGIDLGCRNCGNKLFIPWNSLGYLGGPLVKQAVKACNAQEATGEGAVQRTMDSNHSGLAEERDDRSVGSDSTD